MITRPPVPSHVSSARKAIAIPMPVDRVMRDSPWIAAHRPGDFADNLSRLTTFAAANARRAGARVDVTPNAVVRRVAILGNQWVVDSKPTYAVSRATTRSSGVLRIRASPRSMGSSQMLRWLDDNGSTQ